MSSRPRHGAGRVGIDSIIIVLLLSIFVTRPAYPSGPGLTILPGDDVLAPAAGDQITPYLERGGDLFLAVWVDRRTTVPGDDPDYAGEADVYAARLDASGNLLDIIPFVVSQDVADQDQARACWNGENWLVTWVSDSPAVQHPFPPPGIGSCQGFARR